MHVRLVHNCPCSKVTEFSSREPTMMTSSFRRTTILLLLVAICATPCVWAAGPRAAESSSRQEWGLEPAGLSLLNQLWSTLRALWGEEGCNIDPSGRCLPTPAPQPPSTLQTDNGCGIDPSGRCGS